jgi:hypothetical protein
MDKRYSHVWRVRNNFIGRWRVNRWQRHLTKIGSGYRIVRKYRKPKKGKYGRYGHVAPSNAKSISVYLERRPRTAEQIYHDTKVARLDRDIRELKARNARLERMQGDAHGPAL